MGVYPKFKGGWPPRPFGVCTQTDFLDIGSRDAIDQALSRVTMVGAIRHITRSLHAWPVGRIWPGTEIEGPLQHVEGFSPGTFDIGEQGAANVDFHHVAEDAEFDRRPRGRI